MSNFEEKYDALAEGFSEREYATPEVYSAGRAKLFAEIGPRLAPGASVVDLGCGDGIMAAPLSAYGFRYTGVDSSEQMVAVARRRHPDLEFVAARFEEYAPPEPVDATLCLRAFYYPEDRIAFFRTVAGYTKQKFVFDFRQVSNPAASVRRDLEAAGFTRIEMRPYFVPQRHALPRAAVASLGALQRTGPVALALSHRFGRVFCSASV